MIGGRIDLADLSRIAGWASDLNDTSRILEIDIFIDGLQVARVPADKLRADLAAAGMGDGRKAFDVTLTPMEPSRDHVVEARVVGEGHLINPGALNLTVVNGQVQEKTIPTPRRSGSRHVVVHVGPPKTGTKSIQAALTDHAPALRKRGILYPMHWWTLTQPFMHQELMYGLREPSADLARILSEIATTDCHTIVFSCEAFNLVQEKGWRFFREHLGDADYEFVFYARRISDWVPSQWKQAVKEGLADTLLEYYNPILANADSLNAANFALTLDVYASVFGIDAVSVCSYSNLIAQNGNLVDHFYRNFLDWRELLVTQQDRIHESIDHLTAEWMRAANAILRRQGRETTMVAFNALDRVKDTDEARLIHEAMQRHLDTIDISDHAYPLRLILDQIRTRYRDHTLGGTIFDPRNRSVAVVRQDYLAEPGVAEALHRLVALITAQ